MNIPVARVIKRFLFNTGLFGYLSERKNKAVGLLEGGYTPKSFWQGWSDTFLGQKFQHDIHEGQKRILDKIMAVRPGSVLEAGCGFGRNLNFLCRTLPEAEKISFSGIDISDKLLQRAREVIGNKKVRLSCADICRLPFPSGSFDFVFTHGTLMHIPEHSVKRAVTELVRVAKKDVFCVEEVYWKDIPRDKAVINANRYTFYHNYKKVINGSDIPKPSIEYLDGDIRYIVLHFDKGSS